MGDKKPRNIPRREWSWTVEPRSGVRSLSPARVKGGRRERRVLRRQGSSCPTVGVHGHVDEPDKFW